VALWLTNTLIQTFLLVTWFAEYAFLLALKMTSAMTLVPYFLVAAAGLKLAASGATYASDEGRVRRWAVVCAVIATLYTAAMLLLGGSRYLLLSALLYAPVSVAFVWLRRGQGLHTVLRPVEWGVFALVCIAGLVALHGLTTGAVSV